MVSYCVIWYDMMLFDIIWYYLISYYMTWYGVILYFSIVHSIVLYNVILYVVNMNHCYIYRFRYIVICYIISYLIILYYVFVIILYHIMLLKCITIYIDVYEITKSIYMKILDLQKGPELKPHQKPWKVLCTTIPTSPKKAPNCLVPWLPRSASSLGVICSICFSLLTAGDQGV